MASLLAVARQLLLEGGDALALLVDAGFVGLDGVDEAGHEVVAEFGGELLEQLAGELLLLVNGDAEAEAEFGVVLEERVVPGRAASVLVLGVGRGGQVAAVDGGAAGGVAGDDAVAEELGEQLEVGRLAAAGAGAAELEERLHDLLLAELGDLDLAPVEFRQARKKLKLSRSLKRSGSCGRMLMALSLASVLFLAGQTSTHRQQPVQSSGATWRVHLSPFHSGARASVLLKVAGAPCNAAGS